MTKNENHAKLEIDTKAASVVMESKISADELAKDLSDVLDRVRFNGERFVVELDGELAAVIVPVEVSQRVIVGELFARLRAIGRPDEGFADDLEAIQAQQPTIGEPPESI